MTHLIELKVNIPEKQAYNYDILIGQNIISQADELIRKYTGSKKFLIVTNETIAKLYMGILDIKNAVWLILKDGEEYKNFENYKLILDIAAENNLERNDCIIAFGGGVTGDISGFAAASYMRGCNFVQIPTTLLAQVDSSVGGKVAINLEQGKNLIGAFYQPKLVLSDIAFLKTLSLRQLKTGLAEVLKYAFIEKSCGCQLNYRLFDFLKQNKQEIFDLNPEIISKLINICCTLKASVVNQDETEKGIRAILNLGHTYAHSIENLTNYTVYTHGEAVAIGTKMAFQLALNRGFISKDYFESAMDLIDDYDITPAGFDFDKEKLYNEMFLDKKAKDGKLRFVVPNGSSTVAIISDATKQQIFDSISL